MNPYTDILKWLGGNTGDLGMVYGDGDQIAAIIAAWPEEPKREITYRQMLVTIATMAIRLDDMCAHDVLEALKVFGFADVIREAGGGS